MVILIGLCEDTKEAFSKGDRLQVVIRIMLVLARPRRRLAAACPLVSRRTALFFASAMQGEKFLFVLGTLNFFPPIFSLSIFSTYIVLIALELNIFSFFLVSADNNVHILLEYCSQKSLLHVMKNRKVLTEPEVRYYMMQICEGVRYLHRKSILHRDLKLGNMFLTWDMTVKIGDFGLATQHQASLSSVSTLCGTPNYIAPEVLKKQGHSYEADIWALGCMMFAMLVGTPPFETKSLGRTYAKIAANEYDIPERLSPSAQSFISMLLHPDPKNRGHLHQAGHPADLLSHPFFLSGFCPRKLPQNAASVPPTFPLDTVLNENHIYALASSSASGNSSSSASGNPQSIDSDYSAISTNLDNSNSPTVSNKFRTTLRQKFSQMFTPTASCIMQQPHSAAGNATADLLLQPPPFAQYRPADHLISHIIEALEQWISRRPSVLAGGNEAAAELLLSPISVVPVFVSKWIDYSNK